MKLKTYIRESLSYPEQSSHAPYDVICELPESLIGKAYKLEDIPKNAQGYTKQAVLDVSGQAARKALELAKKAASASSAKSRGDLLLRLKDARKNHDKLNNTQIKNAIKDLIILVTNSSED